LPIKAAQAESAYVKLAPSVKLSHVFTVREHRRLGMGNTLSYGGKLFTLAKPTSFQFNAKTTVEIRETLEGDLILWHQGQALELKETEKVQRKKRRVLRSHANPPQATHGGLAIKNILSIT
jgi:hypothetical protein